MAVPAQVQVSFTSRIKVDHVVIWRSKEEKVDELLRKRVPVWSDTNTIRFTYGKFTTSNPEIIEYLRSHPQFNIDFVEDPDLSGVKELNVSRETLPDGVRGCIECGAKLKNELGLKIHLGKFHPESSLLGKEAIHA